MDNVTTVIDQPSKSFKGNTQTFMEVSQIWADGYRNISDIMSAAAQTHLDHMTATLKAMSDVRTFKGAMELQVAATCTAMEQAVANSNKLSTASMALADQGMAPIKARMDVAMARFT